MTVHDHATTLSLAEPWGGHAQIVDLGLPVHYVDFGGPTEPKTEQPDAHPMVLVHGLGGSHLNWLGVAPTLSRRRRVLALDLAGFGLTPGTPDQATVRSNVLLLARFIREVVGEPVDLVGNSMGGMVSIILAATHPDLVSRLVLIDPSIPTQRRHLDRRVAATFLVYNTPRVGEAFLTRLTAGASDERRVQETTNLCFARPERADPDVTRAAVELVAHRRPEAQAANAAYLSAARSILRVLGTKHRYRDLIGSIRVPVLLIHGEQDRLVSIRAARRVAADHPDWTSVFLPHIGHVPMLEAPDVVATEIDEWLGSVAGRR